MKHDARFKADKLGLARVYMRHQDRCAGGTWMQRTFGRPLYQELIDQARDMGLMSATARAAYYGFTRHGEVATTFHPETGFEDVNIYVNSLGAEGSEHCSSPKRRALVADRVVCSMRSSTGGPPSSTPSPRRTRRPVRSPLPARRDGT